MRYSLPIGKILDRQLKRLETKNMDAPTRITGEIQRLKNAVQALESVALNPDPSHNDARHMARTHEAGERLEVAVRATRQRSNELLNHHSQRLNAKLAERTGLQAPDNVEGILRNSELRAAVRSLEPEARRDVLRDAVKTKDVATLNALVNANPLVVGMDADFINSMNLAYQKSVAPEILDEIDELLEADSALQAAARTAEKVASESQDAVAMSAFIKAESAAKEASVSFQEAMAPQMPLQ